MQFEGAEPVDHFFIERLGENVPLYPLEAVCLSAEQARRPLLVRRATEPGVQCRTRLSGDPAGADWRLQGQCVGADGTRFRVTAEFEGIIGGAFDLRQIVRVEGAGESEISVARVEWMHSDCSKGAFEYTGPRLPPTADGRVGH